MNGPGQRNFAMNLSRKQIAGLFLAAAIAIPALVECTRDACDANCRMCHCANSQVKAVLSCGRAMQK